MIFHVLYDCFCLCWRNFVTKSGWESLSSSWVQLKSTIHRGSMADCNRNGYSAKVSLVRKGSLGSWVPSCQVAADSSGRLWIMPQIKGLYIYWFLSVFPTNTDLKGEFGTNASKFSSGWWELPYLWETIQPWVALLRYCVHTLEPVGDQAPAVPQGFSGHGGYGQPMATNGNELILETHPKHLPEARPLRCFLGCLKGCFKGPTFWMAGIPRSREWSPWWMWSAAPSGPSRQCSAAGLWQEPKSICRAIWAMVNTHG